MKTNGLLAFITKLKAECDTRYNQSGSITRTLRIYCHTCAKSPSARNSNLRWAQNFEVYSRAGKAQEPVRWAKHLDKCKESPVLLSGTSAGSYVEQSRNSELHRAKFIIYYEADCL